MSNKKIIGATSTELDGITFDSKSEKTFYQKLKQAGIEFTYNSDKITLVDKCKLNKVKFYCPKLSSSSTLDIYTRPILSLTYTPDFTIKVGNYICYVEIKGYANDRYPIKRKLFLNHLEGLEDYNYLFFEVHNHKQMDHTIEIIKSL